MFVRVRRWLELGEKHYPKHQTIRNLYTICYEAMKDSNGNTQDSTVTDHVNGEDEQINEGQFESSLLWSSSGNPGGSRVQVVGPPSSTGYPMGMSTPTRPSLAGVNTLTASDSPRKFLPRPSPERLSAQVRQFTLFLVVFCDVLIIVAEWRLMHNDNLPSSGQQFRVYSREDD